MSTFNLSASPKCVSSLSGPMYPTTTATQHKLEKVALLFQTSANFTEEGLKMDVKGLVDMGRAKGNTSPSLVC